MLIQNYKEKLFEFLGTHKIYIRTWGCTHNTSDSEQMAGLLSAAGHQLTNKRVRKASRIFILGLCKPYMVAVE